MYRDFFLFIFNERNDSWSQEQMSLSWNNNNNDDVNDDNNYNTWGK